MYKYIPITSHNFLILTQTSENFIDTFTLPPWLALALMCCMKVCAIQRKRVVVSCP